MTLTLIPRRRHQTEVRLKEEQETDRKVKAEEESRVTLEERKLVLVQRRVESLRLLDAVFERVKVVDLHRFKLCVAFYYRRDIFYLGLDRRKRKSKKRSRQKER